MSSQSARRSLHGFLDSSSDEDGPTSFSCSSSQHGFSSSDVEELALDDDSDDDPDYDEFDESIRRVRTPTSDLPAFLENIRVDVTVDPAVTAVSVTGPSPNTAGHRTYRSRDLLHLAEEVLLPLSIKDDATEGGQSFTAFVSTLKEQKQRAALFLLVNDDSLSHLWKVAAKLKALLCVAWKIDAASYVSSLEAATITLPFTSRVLDKHNVQALFKRTFNKCVHEDTKGVIGQIPLVCYKYGRTTNGEYNTSKQEAEARLVQF
jgi:hypothetical protein